MTYIVAFLIIFPFPEIVIAKRLISPCIVAQYTLLNGRKEFYIKLVKIASNLINSRPYACILIEQRSIDSM